MRSSPLSFASQSRNVNAEAAFVLHTHSSRTVRHTRLAVIECPTHASVSSRTCRRNQDTALAGVAVFHPIAVTVAHVGPGRKSQHCSSPGIRSCRSFPRCFRWLNSARRVYIQRKKNPKQSKEDKEAAAKRQRDLLQATAETFYREQGHA